MRRLIYIGAVALAMAGITGVSAAPLAVSSWAPQSTPNPTGAMYSELNGVSCLQQPYVSPLETMTTRPTPPSRWRSDGGVVPGPLH